MNEFLSEVTLNGLNMMFFQISEDMVRMDALGESAEWELDNYLIFITKIEMALEAQRNGA